MARYAIYLYMMFNLHNTNIYNKCTGGLLIGWFEPNSKPAFENTTVPIKSWKNYLTVDPSRWMPLWDKVVHRLPILKDIRPNIYNCPDNFTPDGRWILGESPEVKNYFVAVGMNGNLLQGKTLYVVLLIMYVNKTVSFIFRSRRNRQRSC